MFFYLVRSKFLRLLAPAVGVFVMCSLLGCASSSTSPVITPAGGSYTYVVQTVTITDAAGGASLFYTTDGSNPSASSKPYTGPLTVTQTETVRAIAVVNGATSSVTTADFTITLPAADKPVIVLQPGTYSAVQTTTITDSTVGASIYYTTDGTTPTSASTLYTGPITISSSETINAIAISTGYSFGYSAVATAQYSIKFPTPPPVLSLAAGSYSSVQNLTITDLASGAAIYYTTDGSIPTTASLLYIGPITIASTETITAIAVATSGSYGGPSLAVSAKYVISLPGYSTAYSGTQYVVGATVQLYAVGSTGYKSSATPLLTTAVTTDKSGGFNLNGKYSCTPGSVLYLTISGGSAGTASPNPNLALMLAIGPCANLTTNSSFVINEATTVAAAYALAQFAQNTTYGQTLSAQPGSASAPPSDNFSTSSTNLIGIANAMAVAQVLTNPSTGSTPGNNANSSAQPEWWQVNLIANLLAACNATTGGVANDGSACGTLFGNVTAATGVAPVDTVQAALDLALYPTLASANIGKLYALIPTKGAPYQPFAISSSAISDFSIAIEYQPLSGTSKLLNQPSGVALDSLGNAWVGNQPISPGATAALPAYFVEMTPSGVPIQAGTATGTYSVNSYSLNGTTQTMGGQYANLGTAAPPTYTVNGLYLPSIDTNNNVWFNDRYNSTIGEITGSGSTYSNSLSYQNGGNASATATALAASSWPVSTYVDGNNSIWFNLGNLIKANGGLGGSPTGCQTGVGAYTSGIGVFLNGSTSNSYLGSTDNDISTGSQGYLIIDPNKTDTAGSKPIPGAPFVWTIGTNGSPIVNLVVHSYTQSPSSGIYPSCNTPLSPIGYGLAAGESGTNPGHTAARISDIANPAANGDFLHFIGPATDWVFDKAGNMWIANHGQTISGTVYAMNSNNTILSAISKVTPNYGSSLSVSSTSNFTFNVFHNVAGLYDGAAITNYPSYLTVDGAGSAWFTLSTNNYVAAITSTGTALSPAAVTANTTAGFSGSVCACTFNGVAQSYQRPNTYALSRPAVDQSGNVWIPVSGSGSTFLDLLVGIAVPRVNPDSLGLKNGNFASLP